MKVVVIHGEDIVASRQRFSKIINNAKNKGYDAVSLTGDIQDLNQLTTAGLFGNKQIYIIEDYKKIDPKIFKWDLNGNILIWYKGEFPKSFSKSLPKQTKYEKFDVPKIIYNFLDSMLPGNTKRSLEFLHELQKTMAAEMISALVNSHLRDIWIVLEDGSELNYQEWRLGKLKRQGQALGKDRVERFLVKLAEADVQAKTGGADLSLMLDLIITKELK